MLIKRSHSVAIAIAIGAVVAVSIGGYLVWSRYGGGYAWTHYGGGYGRTAVTPYGGPAGGTYARPDATPYGGAPGGTYGSPVPPLYGGAAGGTYGPPPPPNGGAYGGTYGSPGGSPYDGTYGSPGGSPYDGTYGSPGGAPYGGTYGSPGATPYGGASGGAYGGTDGTLYGGATGGTYARTDPTPYGGASGGTYGRTNGTSALEDNPYDPVINPRDFVSRVSNRYFRLTPGAVFTFEKRTPAGTERSEVEVTREKRRVMGVLTTVVRHTTWVNGQLKEESRNWYAQDRRGNVWYFGEQVDNFENGRLKDHAGAWEAGINGAKPGIVMLNDPVVGVEYRQESYKGQAEDMGAVIALNRTVSVPFGTFRGCVQTRNWSLIDRAEKEYKYYCPQLGFLAFEEPAAQGGESAQLVSVSTPGGNASFNGRRNVYNQRHDD